MTKVLTDPKYYTAIANAIRAKNGSTEIYRPSGMADAITALTTSSGTTTDSYFDVMDTLIPNLTNINCSRFAVYQRREDKFTSQQPFYVADKTTNSITEYYGAFGGDSLYVILSADHAASLKDLLVYKFTSNTEYTDITSSFSIVDSELNVGGYFSKSDLLVFADSAYNATVIAAFLQSN